MPEKRATLFLFRPQQNALVDRIDDLRSEARSLSASSSADHGDRLDELETDWNEMKQRVRLLGAEFIDNESPLMTGLEQGYSELTTQLALA